jgi:hypothetical protein
VWANPYLTVIYSQKTTFVMYDRSQKSIFY